MSIRNFPTSPTPAPPPSTSSMPPTGLLQILNLEQTVAREEAMRAQESPILPDFIEPGLTGHIRKSWETAKMYRTKTDIRLLECLRAARGVYSEAELSRLNSQGGANIIWMDITDTKSRAAKAWIKSVIMPPGEQAWGLEPSPLPDLPDELRDAVIEKAAYEARQYYVQQAQEGQPWMTEEDFRTLATEIAAGIRDETVKNLRDNAAKRAERMEQHIGEHMIDGGYRQALSDFIDYFCRYPTAILKGPFFQNKDCLVWLPGWEVSVEERAKMSWGCVSPFDAYPAPNASDCQKGDFIERLRLRRDQLYAMIGLPGYNEDAIRGALKDYREGRIESWLWSEMERRRYENDTIYDWLSPHGVIDALHYWGSVPGSYLIQWGMDPADIDPVKDYEIDAIMIGRYVIRAALNAHPLKTRPYRKASFSEVPNAFWGRSVFDLIKSSQKMCNASACNLADNMAMASGGMAWVYTDKLAPGYTDINLYPWKVWQLSSSKNGTDSLTNPGIGFQDMNSHAEEFMTVFKFFEDRADTTSGIPKYLGGDTSDMSDVARTVSIVMNSASKGILDAITTIDIQVIEPMLFDTYVYEMLYGPELSAKGDCNIVARGAAAILIKDSQLDNRKQALSLIGGNQTAMSIVGMRGFAELMREALKMLEVPVDKIVPSDEVLMQREDEMQKQTGQNPELQVYQQVEGEKLASKERQVAQTNQTRVQVEQIKQQGMSVGRQTDQQVKLVQDRTRRDLRAGEIQKDLAISSRAHPAMVPPRPPVAVP